LQISVFFVPLRWISKIVILHMLTTATTQGVYLNIPRTDWNLLQELINRFGWQYETREQLLEKFIQSRPNATELSEEDIMNEVRAVRYA
jgi:hypothetical protein